MPSSCPAVADPAPSLVRPERRKRPRPSRTAGQEHPAHLGETATTESDMKFWLGWFARFHGEEPSRYVAYALRTVDCRVIVNSEAAEPAPQPQTLRCIREVAKFDGAKGVEWLLITWICGLPGVQFQRCTSLANAMARLDAAPSDVVFTPLSSK